MRREKDDFQFFNEEKKGNKVEFISKNYWNKFSSQWSGKAKKCKKKCMKKVNNFPNAISHSDESLFSVAFIFCWTLFFV